MPRFRGKDDRRSRGKVDKEHRAIRDGLRVVGYYVVDTSALGKDFPDLLAVSKAGVIVLLEVKTEGEYPTEGQTSFLINFPGPVSVIVSLEHALQVMSRYDGYY